MSQSFSQKVSFLVLAIFMPAAQNALAQKSLTLGSFLSEFTDIYSLPAYAEKVRCAQVSSYDVTGGNDDGFSGKYSFVRRNADSTLVIFDVKGPGVINRIWTPTPSDDSLAFYIDNLTKPAFTIRYRDLFTGKVFPFVAPLCGNQLGGFYCYFPIAFQENCKIVYKGKKTQFHQIQYKQFAAGTRVAKFNLKLSVAEDEMLSNLKLLWGKNPSSAADFFPAKNLVESTRTVKLQPGESAVIFKSENGGRILGLELSPSAALEGLSRNIDLRITWDDERVPAVYCPAADFFGYAFGKASMKSLLLGTTQGKAYCWFPMPFDKSAQAELIYRKAGGSDEGPLTIQAKFYSTAEPRNPKTEGKFYSSWNKNNPAGKGKPHVFLQTEGKGHYVGTTLQAQGLKAGMTYFFEGDDSTVVDGELRMHGTGSEDYFNGGWYALSDRWDAAMSLPLSGALDYSLPFCRTGGFRLFLTDKISFDKTFYHSIEHGPTGNNAPGDYTSVSYYYCSVPPAATVKPAGKVTRVFLPDTLTLYPQLMEFGIDGPVSIKPSWTYPTGGETYTFTVSGNSGLRVALRGVPPGEYRLFLDFVKDPQGAAFSVWQRQTQVSGWTDTFQASKERREMEPVCDIRVDELVNTVTFRFQVREGKSQFVFNRLILIRK